MFRQTAAVLFLIAVLIQAGFNGAPSWAASQGDVPVQGDWLVDQLSAEPSTLNPIVATDAYSASIDSYIYESLLKRNEKTLELEPVLAERWEISEDHLTYTFYLKKNVFWQDGKPFTARDVQFSFDRIRDPKVDAAHLRNYYRDIKELDVLDDYTVRFRYRVPYFLALEFCGGIPIVPAHVFKEGDDFNQHPTGRSPIGTGPYRFLEWRTGEEVVLVRNENYWGEQPYLNRIVFKVISDATVALQVLKQGGLDTMGLTPIQWVKQTENKRFEENYRKFKYYQPRYTYIGWNMRKPLFSDRRVRQAMTMLVDRDMILKKILFGLGTVVTGPFYINSPEYNTDVKPYPYDPQAAVALLKSAGWEDRNGDGILEKDGVPFQFEFLIASASKFAEQLATILQENLKQVGIRMTIRKLEWAVFIQKIDEHNFDACTLAWSMGWESDPYQIWHSSQADKGSNFVGFSNAEADRIIDAARQEFDKDKRNELYHRFHEIVHEEQPYTFLFTLESLETVSDRFRNVNLYPMGLVPREWWVPRALQKYTSQ